MDVDRVQARADMLCSGYTGALVIITISTIVVIVAIVMNTKQTIRVVIEYE